MANLDEPTLEQKINKLEQWVNLIDDRIDNNQVQVAVRDGIREQFNIVQLKENINHYRRTYDRNNLLIFHGDRIDMEPTAAEIAAIETAKNELISLESLIVLFNHSIVDVIDNRLRPNIGGRRVCKRGRENRSRSSSARKLSSRPRRRSSKSRATQRKQKRRQRRASRRAY